MSLADDMAKLLSLSVVSGEEIEELADLWAGGGRESDAFVEVILGEIATVEKMVSFLAWNLQDNLQDSVLIAASKCTLWQLRTHVEAGFCAPQSPPRINFVEPFCQYRPEFARMSIAQKLSSITPSDLRSARHTFQEALRISSENDVMATAMSIMAAFVGAVLCFGVGLATAIATSPADICI